jgi:beta-glucosidase
MPAMETALIFTAHKSSTVFLPEKELREFIKVHLDAGETKQVSVSLDTSEFGYYNPHIKDWHTESGDYKIMVGSSSQSCELQSSVFVSSPAQPQPDLKKTAPTYFDLPKGELVIPDHEFESLYGKKLPVRNCRPSRPYTMNNTPEDVKHTFVGKIIIMYAKAMAKKVTQVEEEQEGMMLATILEMPFFAMVGSGEMSESMAYGIIDMLNGHFFRGLRKFFK